ncbi:rhodanese-like domain-containing protein [Botrimarina sp.]|uniref:rhodanese-like domain-containing protein n=1 Tax=Botrimarina sp. TaxID=2795802 RepID=UPI0032EB89CC
MKTIDANELKKLKAQDDVLIVNTLPEDKFESTEIPDAVNVPQEDPDFVEKVEKIAGGKSKPVVVYCASESCHSSDKAASKLEKAGYQEVYDFAAGAEGWRQVS